MLRVLFANSRRASPSALTVRVPTMQLSSKAKGGAGKEPKDSKSSASSSAVSVKKTPIGKVAAAPSVVAVKKAEPPNVKTVLGGLLDEEMDDLGGGADHSEADVDQLLNMSDFSLSVDNFGIARLLRVDPVEKLHVMVVFDTDFSRSQARHVLDQDAVEQLDQHRFSDEDAAERDEDEDDDDDVAADRHSSGGDDVPDFNRRGGALRLHNHAGARKPAHAEPDVVRRRTAADEIDDDDEDDGGVDPDVYDSSSDVYVYDRAIGVHIVKPGHSEVLLSCIAAADGTLIVRTIASAQLEASKEHSDTMALMPNEFINDGRGVPFFELSRDLQDAFREWLSTIGIDDSVATFMQEFIESRKCREQSHTLSVLKDLVLSSGSSGATASAAGSKATKAGK